MSRRFAVGFVSMLLAMFAVPVGGAQAGDGHRIVVTPASVEVGQSYEVSFSGFICNFVDSVNLVLFPTEGPGIPLTSVLPGDIDSGSWGPVTFVAAVPPGSYIISAEFDECGGSPAEAPLTVTEASTTTTAATTTTTAPVATTTTVAGAVAPTAPPTTLTTNLPATGQTNDGLVWAALAALLLGSGFVMVAARRS